MTDIVQVTLLVLGGLLVSGLTLNEIGGGAGSGRRGSARCSSALRITST